MANTPEEVRAKKNPTLDVANHFAFALVDAPDGGTMLELDLSRATRKFFIGHLHELLTVEVNGQPLQTSQTIERAHFDKKLHFPLPPLQTGALIRLSLNGQSVSELVAEAHGQLVPANTHHEKQFAGCETRALGRKLRRSPNKERNVLGLLPYSREARQGFDVKTHAPITDVHTHYSAQISGAELLNTAIDMDLSGTEIAYPIELLKLLNVYPATDGAREVEQYPVDMVGRDFNPMRDEGLKCESGGTKCKGIRVRELTKMQREAIIRKMDIPPDGTMSFSDFDREMYRYRNPFVKHPDLAKPIIKKIAEEYARNGVEYAELSTGSMLDPEWFKQMAEALEEIERDGVGSDKKKPILRFLIGLPRNASSQKMMVDLEKVKFLARHPSIVGVDLLGYESNKTSDFHWALSHMAQWAEASENTELNQKDGWDFQRDFIIRVHAGETSKNPENVRDAIRIAHDHKVRVRVGHGLNYTLDAESQRNLNELNATAGLNGLANPDLFATERCMDSNQVYRTKLLVHNQPPILDAPRFLGSDGGGALGVGPVQMAYSALASGWTLEQLKELRQFEKGYVGRQKEREILKSQAYTKLYGVGDAGLDRFLAQYKEKVSAIPRSPKPSAPESDPLLNYLPEQFHGKTPILIGGASGSSWKDMDKFDREQIERSVEFLVRSCDPKKTYFVLGRVQNDGVSKALDVAVKNHNKAHPTEKFAVLGRKAESSKRSGEQADTVTWIQDIPQGRDYVPASMLNFVRDHHGHAIFFNGSDFTAEMAYGSPDRHIPHALHEPRKGKMVEVAQTSESESQFRSFEGFVENVFGKQGPDCFFRTEAERKAVMRENISLPGLMEEVQGMKLTSSSKAAQIKESRAR